MTIATRSIVLACSVAALAASEQAMGVTTTFDIATIDAARKAAAARADTGRAQTPGWSKSRVDPARIVDAFPVLRVKKGYVLRAYLFSEGGNGNGFVYAMPADAPFPEPGDAPRVDTHFLKPPRPPAALDDVMGAIDGDGTPLSYLSASLLRRELGEFGASWHGIAWGTHAVLDRSPVGAKVSNAVEMPVGKPADWKWRKPEPADWHPTVTVRKDRVVVEFYTFTAHGQQTITKFTDTFTPGSYVFTTQEQVIAEGPPGFMF